MSTAYTTSMISQKPVLLFNQVRTAPAGQVQAAATQSSTFLPDSESMPILLNQRQAVSQLIRPGTMPVLPQQSPSNPLDMSSVATGTQANTKAAWKKTTKLTTGTGSKRQLGIMAPPRAKSKLKSIAKTKAKVVDNSSVNAGLARVSKPGKSSAVAKIPQNRAQIGNVGVHENATISATVGATVPNNKLEHEEPVESRNAMVGKAERSNLTPAYSKKPSAITSSTSGAAEKGLPSTDDVAVPAHTVTQWHAPDPESIVSAAAMSFRRATRTKRPNVPLPGVGSEVFPLMNEVKSAAKSREQTKGNDRKLIANQVSLPEGYVQGRRRRSRRSSRQSAEEGSQRDAQTERETLVQFDAGTTLGNQVPEEVPPRRKSVRIATRSQPAELDMAQGPRTRAESEEDVERRRDRGEQCGQHDEDFRKRRRASLSGRTVLAESIGIREVRRPRKGDRVEILWEDRNQTYQGLLRKRSSRRGWIFEVKYDDGDELIEDLDDVHWRLLPGGAWVEPGDLAEGAREAGDRTFAPKLKGAQDVPISTEGVENDQETLQPKRNGDATATPMLFSRAGVGVAENHGERKAWTPEVNRRSAEVGRTTNEAGGTLDEDTVELELA